MLATVPFPTSIFDDEKSESTTGDDHDILVEIGGVRDKGCI